MVSVGNRIVIKVRALLHASYRLFILSGQLGRDLAQGVEISLCHVLCWRSILVVTGSGVVTLSET